MRNRPAPIIFYCLAITLSFFCSSSLVALELTAVEHEQLRKVGQIVFVSQISYPPFEFEGKNGQREGMMLDMVRWLSVELGFNPVFMDAPFAQAQEMVLSGKADLITSLFYSDKRNERFAFTSTLFEVPASIFVKAERTDIKGLDDLNGTTIAIQKGDYAKDFLESKGLRFTLLDTADFATATDLVVAGRADAVVGDEQIVLYHMYKHGLTTDLKKVGEPLYTGRNCMAGSKKNAAMVAIINKGIEEAKKSGALDNINKKWLGTMYGSGRSWLDRYYWHLTILAAVFVLLLASIWAWNLRLRTVVRRKTLDIARGEMALRESEAKYRDLFENASDIIYTLDLNGNFTSVNEAARRIVGYTSEEFLAMNYRDLVVPDYLDMVQNLYRLQLSERIDTTEALQFPVRTKDGAVLWFEVTSRIVGDPDHPQGQHGTARDITARKRAEEALRESQEKYRLVVENASEAIYVAQDGILKFTNPKTREIVDYTQEELNNRPFVELIHPEDRALVMERYQRRLRGESAPNAYSFRVVDRGGRVKWVEINVIKIDWEGRPATLNFVVDVSAKRRMEEELLKVQKLESLGILAGGIAHDFNNILTAVLGNISLARIGSLSPDQVAAILREAERACLQARNLTQQLLTFAKGGAPVRSIVDISHLVRESCAFALRGSNARSEFALPVDLWSANVDEGQISQVINNLMINADQAMPQGGVIAVRGENVASPQEDGLPLPPGKYLHLTIQDHGIGIPASILPRIFDPYFTTKQKGSGLGLATSYSIIANHNGFITVESEPNSGSTFHLYLPAVDRPAYRPSSPEEIPPAGRGRILVMDDEEAIRDLIDESLSLLGYDVTTTKDGLEAVKVYRQALESARPFDAVILDLTVPGAMGGQEAMTRLRVLDPEVKAIVSSGYSREQIMAEYRKSGFGAVVPKPYTVKELASALNSILGQKTRAPT